jgi:uncharacterized membrane protein YjjP (DUF1212 family)
MSKTGKIVLGIVSFLPILLFATYIAFFIGLFTSVFREGIQQQSGRPPEFIMNNVGLLMAIVPLLIVTSLGLLIYYIVHIMNNTRLQSTERLIWIFIIIFTSMIGYPIYWYMQIWKAPVAPAYSS